ncbi:hypothetical protein BU15DRAFT_59949 [Melanogaster broomeanus]|nr:hypothetical protein BU15DRAFT_59949 [Melanogaster broomeanus]
MSSIQVSPCRTRAKNANAHPGNIVIQAQQKQRTKAQKAADNAHDEEVLKEKEVAAAQGLERLAGIQMGMVANEAQAAAPRPKGVCPRPRPFKKALIDESEDQPTGGPMVDGLGGQDATGALVDDDEDAADVEGDLEMQSDEDTAVQNRTKPKKGKKAAKPSLKVSIECTVGKLTTAVGLVDLGATEIKSITRVGDQKGKLAECASFLHTTMLMLTESTLFFLNLTSESSSSKKFSLDGRVNNWNSKTVSDLQSRKPSATPTHSSLGGTSTWPPPSSIFSAFSRSTAPTSIPDPDPVASSACSDDDLLIGGYADEDLLDDSQERDAASQNQVKGKQAVKIITSRPTGRAPNKPLAVGAGTGTLKRKEIPEDALSVLETEGKPSDESDVEILGGHAPMDVNTPHMHQPEPIHGHVKQEHQTNTAPTAPLNPKTHQRTTSTSVLTTAAKLPPAKKVKKEDIPVVLVPDSEESDSDDMAPDNTAAQGPRATTSVGYWVEKVLKARSAYRNPDLPSSCQEQCRWSKIFIPTPHIWKLTDADVLLPALTEIFAVVYPDVKYKVSAQGSVFGVVAQRVNEWHSNFGSTALAIMNDFFSCNKDISTTDLSTSLLQKCTFVYENLDKLVKSEAFRSVFILQLLATVHIHSTIGHANILALDTEKLASCGITGALSVCATAIERSLICIHDGAFVTEDILTEATQLQLKHLKVKTPKSLNEATRKETTTKYAFSVANWEDSTLSYLQSISGRGDSDLQIITSMARTILKKRGPDNVNKYLGMSESGEEADKRTLLW